MSRPLLGPCLGIVAGIGLAGTVAADVDPTRVGIAICVWAPGHFLAARRIPVVRRWIPILGSFFLGWLLWMRSQIPQRPEDLRCLTDSAPRLVSLRAELLESPVLKLSGPADAPRPKSHVLLRVSEMRLRDQWVPASGDVIASLPGVFPVEFFRTRTVEVHGVLKEPPGARAPGLFDAQSFYALQSVWRLLETDAIQDWQLDPVGAAPVRMPWSERFLEWARVRLAAGLPDDEATRLLAAMALGWKTPLTGEVDDAFMQSGTLHVFAISGLHIALVAGLLVKLFQLVRFSRERAGLGAIPCLWLYVAATGWQASAIRSGIMTSVIVVGWALVRPSDLLNSLAGAACVILAVDPGQLFQAGFLLSFVAVAGLAVLAPPIQEWLLERLIPRGDPFLPVSLRPRWHRWVEGPIRAFVLALATGIAAGLSTLPLVWHFFHLVSPVGLVANLLVVPLSSLALAAEFGSLFCSPLFPKLGEVFNASAWIWMKLMIIVGRWSAEVPGGHIWVAAPAWYGWIPWYALLVASTLGIWRTRWGRIAGGSMVGLWTALAVWFWSQNRARLEVTVFGRGEAVWVGGGHAGDAMLIDTGNRSDALSTLIPWIHAQGMGQLPMLCLTRRDRRHSGGLAEILQGLRPRLVAASARWSGLPEVPGVPLPPHGEAVALQKGDQINGWSVIFPETRSAGRAASDLDVALIREWNGFRIAWLADLGPAAQSRIASASIPPVDLLITGASARGEPVSEALIDQLRPRAILLAAEASSSIRLVSPAARLQLRNRGVVLWRTDRVGTVTIRLGSEQIDLDTMNGFHLELRRIHP